jgi:hypothetical protein
MKPVSLDENDMVSSFEKACALAYANGEARVG